MDKMENYTGKTICIFKQGIKLKYNLSVTEK